jgi:hypothetical protein
MTDDKSKRRRRSYLNGFEENGIDYSSTGNDSSSTDIVGEHGADADLALDPPLENAVVEEALFQLESQEPQEAVPEVDPDTADGRSMTVADSRTAPEKRNNQGSPPDDRQIQQSRRNISSVCGSITPKRPARQRGERTCSQRIG